MLVGLGTERDDAVPLLTGGRKGPVRPLAYGEGDSCYPPRWRHGCVAFETSEMKSFAFVFGGRDGQANVFDDIWCSTDGGVKWTQLPQKLPYGMHTFAYCYVAACDSVFIFGGLDASETILDSVVVLRLGTKQSQTRSGEETSTAAVGAAAGSI